MSLKRAKDRQLGGENENYATPAWVTDLLIGSGALPLGGRWLEPAVGDGAIVRRFAAVAETYETKWTAFDVRETDLSGLEFEAREHADYLALRLTAPRFSVAITNPPFSLAERFLDKMRIEAETVAMLLPMSWFGGDERQTILRAHRPDLILAIPNRIQFIDPTIKSLCDCVARVEGEPDPEIKARGNKLGQLGCTRCKGTGISKATSPSTDHAWWIWRAGRARRTEFEWLPTVSKAERQWWTTKGVEAAE